MQLLRDGVLSPLAVARVESETSADVRLVPIADFDASVNTAVLIEPDSETTSVAPLVLDQERIFIDFPTFTDGRGYSHARTLRLVHRYAGELVAFGDVRRDQLEFLRRVGIDAFVLDDDADPAEVVGALDELSQTIGHRFYGGAVNRAPSSAAP